MKLGAHFLAIALISVIPVPRCRASSVDGDPQTSHQLSLADLAGYRAALSGKPTADLARASDPPVQAKFKDLWNRPDVFRGRRVTVQGNVARIFRQGPVGSFPPLAEVWLTSPAGDPFCIVFPQPGSTDLEQAVSSVKNLAPTETNVGVNRAEAIPEPGRTVRFTGTFLKMVRYAGGDGARLAPLIVGDQPPARVTAKSIADQADRTILDGTRGGGGSRTAFQPAYWAFGLALAVLAAVTLARWQLRAPAQPAASRATPSRSTPDPPLKFVEPQDEP